MNKIYRLNKIVRLNSLLLKQTNKIVCLRTQRLLSTVEDKIHTEIPKQEGSKEHQHDEKSFNYSNFTEEQLKKKILENALNHIVEHGFTKEALVQGAVETGLSSAAVNGMFQNGAFELIDYFYKKSNENMSVYLQNLVKEGLVTKKNELIRAAILYRLSLIQPYIKQWPEAMAIQSFQSYNAVQSIENLLRLCDEIWYLVGDKSTDFSWYTKRLTLALMYKSTEIFMIQDKSDNFVDTTKFLDNRFEDLANFYKLNQEVGNLGQAVTGTLAVLKNVMNIRI